MIGLPLTTFYCKDCKKEFYIVTRDLEEKRNDKKCPECRSCNTYKVDKKFGDK